MVRKPPSYDRSFASNEERAACWHATKNGKVKPRDVLTFLCMKNCLII